MSSLKQKSSPRGFFSKTYILLERFESFNRLCAFRSYFQLGKIQMLIRLKIIQTQSVPAVETFMEIFARTLFIFLIFEQILAQIRFHGLFFDFHFTGFFPSFIRGYLLKAFLFKWNPEVEYSFIQTFLHALFFSFDFSQ